MFNYEALQIILQERAAEVIQPDTQGQMMHWRGREKRIDYGENNLLYHINGGA